MIYNYADFQDERVHCCLWNENIYRRRFKSAMNNEGNILAELWKKRYEALTPDIQKRIYCQLVDQSSL